MNKFIYCLATVLVLGTTVAFAAPGGEGENTGCNGQGNPSSPCDTGGSGGSGGSSGAGGAGGAGGEGGTGGSGGSAVQEQIQGQLQAQKQNQIVANRNDNDVSSSSRSSSGSSSRSDSASTSGAVASSGGNTQAVTDASNTEVELNYNYRYDNDYSASSAASIYGDVCTGGMSGQVEEGGFAITNPNAFCNYMSAALIYRDAFEWEMTYNVSEQCAEPMSFEWPEGQYMDTCMNDKAQEMLENYYSNLENANEYMELVEIPAKIDGIFGYFVRPIAVIAVMILLI